MSTENKDLAECISAALSFAKLEEDNEYVSITVNQTQPVSRLYELFEELNVPDRFIQSYTRGIFEMSGTLTDNHMSFYLPNLANKLVTRVLSQHGFKFTRDEDRITINKEDVKNVLRFLYTAGPSLGKRALAEKVAGSVLCAHPDAHAAELWIHDLLYHS